jgi:protein gp37
MPKTKIQWTDATWNPITGCTPMSPGCANCYAKKHTLRLQRNPNPKIAYKYRNGFDLTVHPNYLEHPRHWADTRMVFVNSMSDTFHHQVPVEFLRDLFEVIAANPSHVFQVLTKRAERLAELGPILEWPGNLWVGVTVENADYLYRLNLLREVPAMRRFVSFEPLIGEIGDINLEGIHWVIVGGESGSQARPMDLRWARDIRDQCLEREIPFFFKQVGGRDRQKGGRLLDGQEWNQFPERETPAE